MRLLTIGNSFAGNATTYLEEMAKAADRRVILVRANLGGASLERHWRHMREHERDPESPEGRPYRIGGGKRSLREALEMESWDFVTIQQFSWLSHDPETYRPYARDLLGYIRRHAPQAEVRMHQTWAYRADELRPGYTEQEHHHADIRAAYHTIAAELGIGIIPVGEAFKNVRRHPDWHGRFPDPEFDPETADYPELPDQKYSLCRGHFWRKDEEGWKLHLDTHHANAAGCYLGSAVFYEALFGESVVGNRYRPEGPSAERVAFLQRIAHDTVADRRNTTPHPPEPEDASHD